MHSRGRTRHSCYGGFEMKRSLTFTAAAFDEGSDNRSTLVTHQAITTYFRIALIVGLFIFVLTPILASAQEQPQVFALPEARVGEAYRVNLEDVLREKYRLKL